MVDRGVLYVNTDIGNDSYDGTSANIILTFGPKLTMKSIYIKIHNTWNDNDYGIIDFRTNGIGMDVQNSDQMLFSVVKKIIVGTTSITKTVTLDGINQTYTFDNIVNDGSSPDDSVIVGIQTNANLTNTSSPAYFQRSGYIGVLSRFIYGIVEQTDPNPPTLRTFHIGSSSLQINVTLNNFKNNNTLLLEQLDGSIITNFSSISVVAPPLTINNVGNAIFNVEDNTFNTSNIKQAMIFQLRYTGFGAGGDPHIKTCDNVLYDIPHDWNKLNLLTAIRDNYNLTVDATTKKLNHQELSQLHKFVKNGRGRIINVNVNKEKYYLENTYFDKLFINFNGEKLMIDCSTLQATGNYNKFDFIKLNREKPSNGIYSYTYNKNYPITKSTKQRNITCGDIIICCKSDVYWDEYNDINILLPDVTRYDKVSGAVIENNNANLISKFQ